MLQTNSDSRPSYRRTLWERLWKQYPLDYAMLQEIAKNFMKIRRNVSTSFALQEDQDRDIIFTVSRRSRTTSLSISEDGIILLASITDIYILIT